MTSILKSTLSLPPCRSYAVSASGFYRQQSPSAKILRILQSGPNGGDWGDIFPPELGLTATAFGGVDVPDRLQIRRPLASADNDGLQLSVSKGKRPIRILDHDVSVRFPTGDRLNLCRSSSGKYPQSSQLRIGIHIVRPNLLYKEPKRTRRNE